MNPGRLPSAIALSVTVFALAACGAENEDGTPGDEHDARFVRSWLLTGADGWALLPTMTVYRFDGDGTISIDRQIDGSYFDGPVGSWVLADGATRCWFGDYWRSEGANTVVVDAECDDGSLSEARLQFPNDATSNAEGAAPELVAPAGASPRWIGPQGQFRLCLAVEGDEFELRCTAP